MEKFNEYTEKLLKEMGEKSSLNINEASSIIEGYFEEINEYRKKNYSLKNIYLSLKNSNRLKLSNEKDISQSSFNHEYYKLASRNKNNIKFPAGRPKGSKTKCKKIINSKNSNLKNNLSSTVESTNDTTSKDIKSMSVQEKIVNRRNIAENLKNINNDNQQSPEENPFGFGNKK